ncbi:hypothetical protein Tco_0485615 [Tanacetum coccineum]
MVGTPKKENLDRDVQGEDIREILTARAREEAVYRSRGRSQEYGGQTEKILPEEEISSTTPLLEQKRLVDSAFRTQLGKNLKAYVDDMVIKSKTEQEMILDIAETFDNLRRVNMKSNSRKCSHLCKRREVPQGTSGLDSCSTSLVDVTGIIHVGTSLNVRNGNVNDGTIPSIFVDSGNAVKEVVSPIAVDETVTKERPSPLMETTNLGSYPPLPTQGTTTAGATPGFQKVVKMEVIKDISYNSLLEQWRDSYPDNYDYDLYDDDMYENHDMFEHLQSICDDLDITNQYQKADVLSKLTSIAFNHLTKEVLVEVLNAKSVDAQEISTIVEEEEDNWMTPIIKCLEEVWLADENEARTLWMKISQLKDNATHKTMVKIGTKHTARDGTRVRAGV